MPTNRRNAWIRRLVPAPEAAIRLVCLPHAGGSAGAFFGLATDLAPDVEVLAVQYPGRQDRIAEPPLERLGDLAEGVITALLAERPGRYAILGHSMGAALAFEVARRSAGRLPEPEIVVASACPPPGTVRRPGQLVHRLDDAAVVAELTRIGGSDGALLSEPDLLPLILPSVRADFHAVETYQPPAGSTVACPIAAFTGDRDVRVDAAQAAGWDTYTTGGFALHTFPGGHFYLQDPASGFTERLRAVLSVGRPSTTVGS
ncbi:alpha/beta fold hydrolase [Micromonospora zamorensis]|uniref:thioesterase II family protein n=1 Tax=Micromonospora zamorensis TaxID=709883 RepID=UPI0033F65917